MNVLLAEDEPLMLQILHTYFSKSGFTVFPAQDGEEALDLFFRHKVDVIILDWMMPKLSGIEVCKTIKQHSSVKILLLTAKSEHQDEWIALQSGADDYIRKPFDPRVLLLRTQKLVRPYATLSFHDVTIDMEKQKIFRRGEDVRATNKEFQLMKFLVENKGQIIARKRLLDHVWGFDYFGEERTVDTHIRRLREKIGEHLIRTHRGMGYCLEAPDE